MLAQMSLQLKRAGTLHANASILMIVLPATLILVKYTMIELDAIGMQD